MNRGLFILLCCCVSHIVWAQQLQQVSGRVTDGVTQKPLASASVVLVRDTMQWVTVADESGRFAFNAVAPGRYVVNVSFTGYASSQHEIVVISARRNELDVRLIEFQNTLDEVEITASRSTTYTPGEHSITVEKALRIPANFFDPVRVITSYPGVMTANDQNNTIIMRGNSPSGLLWRINGLDIVNPNHLANAGTFSDKPAAYGGGVNIISSQLMDRTNFYTGSLPARYGNALSGVVDMSLRSGDTTGYHYTAQASLIGIDLAAEGPLGKKQNTSFLANYRYSTVGLLSKMGVKFGDEDISFQDLTFALNSLLRNGGSLSWFGFYGSSKNVFEHEAVDKREVDKDRYDIDYTSQNYGTGLTYNKSVKKAHIATGVSVSGNRQERDQTASPAIPPGLLNIVYADRLHLDKVLVSAYGRLSAKLDNYQIETGMQVNYHHDDMYALNQTGLSGDVVQQGNVKGLLLQPYAQWKVFLSERWNTQAAMRYVYYSYNETGALEPRIALEFLPTLNSSIKFSYNLVSQVQQAGTYLNANKNLALSKAHHVDLGYTYSTTNGFNFLTTVYYQQLFDIPIRKTASSYSLINSIEVYAPDDLVSDGTGRNYGIEVLAEKSFVNKSYLIAGGSYYKSQYKGSDDVLRNTRFDGNYTVNLTYGQEWSKTKKQSYRTFGLSSRALYLGGLRESPIIADPTTATTVYDESRAFENKLNDYFRLDLRLSWRKNKRSYTRTIAIDIQNILNIENEAYRYYDHTKGAITTQYQLGLMPVLVYRIDF